MAALRRVVLLVRDVHASTAWYAALGLRATVLAPGAHARLDGGGDSPGVPLDLLLAPREAELCTGYSPALHVELPEGTLDALVPQLLATGGRLDGPIRHGADATVAVLRSPDGHMLCLYECDAGATPVEGGGPGGAPTALR